MKVVRILAVSAACAFIVLTGATARAFTCTPDAIAKKAAYTMSVWNWLNSSESDSAPPKVFSAKIDRIWDGNGDCSGDEDLSTFNHRTQVDLVLTHFYGDMMTVAFAVGAKQYDIARRHYDDWVEADKLIRSNPENFPDSMVADDTRQRGRMLEFNAQLKKLGYAPKAQ